MNTIPTPVAIVCRVSKGCGQYEFNTVQELADWAARKPYRDEHLMVMPMHSRRWLAKQVLPAAEASSYVERVVGQARQNEQTATLMATTLLKQAEQESAACALWFVSAMSKLAKARPDLEAAEILSIICEAMPRAAEHYTRAAALKG